MLSLFQRASGYGSSERDNDLLEESLRTLDGTSKLVEKRHTDLELKIEQQTRIARENARTNRKKALLALKKKKLYEKNLGQLEGSLLTLETQKSAIESSDITAKTVRAMRGGASALKSFNIVHTPESVHETMEDIREHMEDLDEVTNALSQPSFLDIIDEDDLDAELDALYEDDTVEAEYNDVKTDVQQRQRQNVTRASDIVFPDVCSDDLGGKNTRNAKISAEEEQELAELMKEFG